MDLTNFATPEHPLRPSSIDRIVSCTVKAALDHLEPDNDEGGPAAQTGSLVHAAVAEFHTGDKATATERAWTALRSQAHLFPLADPDECRLHLTPYLNDPRNKDAKVVAVETKVRLELDPHPSDSTQKPVVIQGTFDQIREEYRRLWIYDLKTGKPAAQDLMHAHLYQQMAYVLAARQAGYKVVGAKLIRNYAYRQRDAKLPSPDGVFIEMPFDIETAELMMGRVVEVVARIRNGQLDWGPGHACLFCRWGGILNCVPEAKKRFGF